MAAEARQNADSLKEELERLKNKLKDEEASKLAAEAQKNEKDDFLHQSVLDLLSNFHSLIFSSSFLDSIVTNEFSFLLFAEDADIPADTLSKLPDDSPVDVLTLALESSKLIQVVL
jgi:hypothetical protein